MKTLIAVLILALCQAAGAVAQTWDFAFVPWGAVDLPVPAAPAAGMSIALERQSPVALQAWTGGKDLPHGISLWLLTVCAELPGVQRTSPGRIRSAIAARGISLQDQMVTRQTLRQTRSQGASTLAKVGQVFELVGPGVIAATVGGAIQLRPREVAVIASALAGGKIVVEAGRERRDRAREEALEIDRDEKWFWTLPASIELSAGGCTDTMRALGTYRPDLPKAFLVRLKGVS